MSATKRRVAAMVAVMVVCMPLALNPRAAWAEFPEDHQIAPFAFTVDATTTIKKLNQTITVKGGHFVGAFDLTTLQLEGSITLPPTTFTYQIAGIVPVITATAQIVPVGIVTGTANFLNYTVTATSRFHIKIVSAYAPGIPINLVGDVCQTESPVTVTMSGSIMAPRVFSGTFTLPNFKKCQYSTVALNQLLPGPGNTFSATAY